MIRYRTNLPCVLVLLFLGGCNSKSPSGLPVTRMTLGSQTFTLEIADSPATREKGLMHRDSLPSRHGMIFIFPADQPQSFWMKNTRIPLDIIYINSQSQIVSIHTMRPYDTRSTRSAAPAKFVIELNAGKAAEIGLKAGQSVSLPADLPQAKDSF